MALARTYGEKEETQQDKVLKEARDLLRDAAGKLDDKDPLRWVATAWIGRAYAIGGEPKDATTAFNEVTGSTSPAAASGKRLARYVEILPEFEKQAPAPSAES